MADFTSVGAYISVGSDPPPDATGRYDLVVLVAAEHQHVGEVFPGKVLRCPLTDDGVAPSLDAIKRAQACAERIAWTASPWTVPWEIARRFNRDFPGALGRVDGPGRTVVPEPEPKQQKNVLVCCEAGHDRSC